MTTKKHWVTAILLATAVTAACGGQPTWKQNPTTNAPRKHVVVQFSDASVRPAIARVTAGGGVAWVNHSSSYSGSVVFAESVAEAFTCKSLRPVFMKAADGYHSLPITNEGRENVALPCPLEPGEYDYEIHLFEARRFDPVAGMGDPNATLPAKIVVE